MYNIMLKELITVSVWGYVVIVVCRQTFQLGNPQISLLEQDMHLVTKVDMVFGRYNHVFCILSVIVEPLLTDIFNNGNLQNLMHQLCLLLLNTSLPQQSPLYFKQRTASQYQQQQLHTL